MLLPTRGTVLIDRQTFITKKLLSRYEKIAYLPEETFLPHSISVSKFLKTLTTKAADYVSEHYSSKLMNHLIGSLSSGELRLLELIFVISLNRMFLLLDEPFTGIEPLTLEKLIALISKQRDIGKGILITDHYYRYTSQLSDFAYLMKEGECQKLDEHMNLEKQLQAKGYSANQSTKPKL